jgi:hypothetical protein
MRSKCRFPSALIGQTATMLTIILIVLVLLLLLGGGGWYRGRGRGL